MRHPLFYISLTVLFSCEEPCEYQQEEFKIEYKLIVNNLTNDTVRFNLVYFYECSGSGLGDYETVDGINQIPMTKVDYSGFGTYFEIYECPDIRRTCGFDRFLFVPLPDLNPPNISHRSVGDGEVEYYYNN